jgi:hypothetical protein
MLAALTGWACFKFQLWLLTLLLLNTVHPGYFEDHRSRLCLQHLLAELVSNFWFFFKKISQKQKQQIEARLSTLLEMNAVHPGYSEDHRSGLWLHNWLAELFSNFNYDCWLCCYWTPYICDTLKIIDLGCACSTDLLSSFQFSTSFSKQFDKNKSSRLKHNCQLCWKWMPYI